MSAKFWGIGISHFSHLVGAFCQYTRKTEGLNANKGQDLL